MARRHAPALLALALALAPLGALAGPPLPEPGFAHPATGAGLPRDCGADLANPYEVQQYADEGWASPAYVRYPGTCQRLRFAFGPIHVKPGQNDVLIQPVTIEKPAYDGYITRFAPNLVRADGSIPPIEQVHLHHGTWLSLNEVGLGQNFGNVVDTRTYGSGPFFASGEEKTIANFPRGYGIPIKGTDQWELLYMIHNYTPNVDEVWLTYDLDYVAKASAEAAPISMRPIYPIWLDVLKGSSYPVFNVQRGFGTGGTCQWPRQNCARFDPWGRVTAAQGLPPTKLGFDWALPSAGASLGRISNFQGGTLIGIGGHVHPGGLSVDVDLVRGVPTDPANVRRIFTSKAVYWDWATPAIEGGAPTSWDLSMTVTGTPRWAVHVKPGDRLRINATYDALIQSTYENMGIAVAYISPDVGGTPVEARAIDPFDPAVPFDGSEGCVSGGIQASTPTLCDKGVVTHGHMTEADNKGHASGTLTGAMSSHTDQVAIAGFAYAPGDLNMVGVTGIPTVSKGANVRFTNYDMGLNVYHTVTSCGYPCTGPTGIAFPLADGASSAARPVDFDSSELGYGLPIGPAKNSITWDLSIDSGYQSGEVYTYFCRIHPAMRGAFAVE